MSTKCPLCGDSKSEDSLFCTNCTEKLNSEYEVDVPASESSEEHTDNIAPNSEDKIEERSKPVVEEEKSDKEPFQDESEDIEASEASEDVEASDELEVVDEPRIEDRRKIVAAPNFDKKAWKRQREDKRTNSNKSYYQLSKEQKGNKVLAIIFIVIVLVLALAASLYIYNKNVKSANLERSAWETAQRTHTVDSYLTYMDAYPKGAFFDEAYSSINQLRSREEQAFENLKTSENTIEFTDFLERYPKSPFLRLVKSRLDSLVWQSSLKENTAEAYTHYIDQANSQVILGDYIGQAEKRYKMLNQATPIDGGDLELIRRTVDGFFIGASTLSQEQLSQHTEAVVARFNNSTNLPNTEVLSHLLIQASEANSNTVKLEADVAKLTYQRLGNDTYEVNVPVEKTFETYEGEINQIKGYIVHLKLSPTFKVYSYHETKPYPEAP